MKVFFNTEIRADLEDRPLQIYCQLCDDALSSSGKELVVHLYVDDEGFVDAKQLVEALRAIARVTTKELKCDNA